MFVFRDALLSPQATYDSVLDFVCQVRLAAPEYVVISGAKNAALIARDPGRVANLTTLTLSSSMAEDTWFGVQTNYDRDEIDPPSDNRRSIAEGVMRQYGQKIGASKVGLFAALSTYPVHNPTTAYTAIMHAATGELDAFQRSYAAKRRILFIKLAAMSVSVTKASNWYFELDCLEGERMIGSSCGSTTNINIDRKSTGTFALMGTFFV